jgi:hypothetical protein
MREPEEVSAMLKLHELGWGTRRIARELGVSRNSVKRYLAEGGWVAYRSPQRVARQGARATPGSRPAELQPRAAWVAFLPERQTGSPRKKKGAIPRPLS